MGRKKKSAIARAQNFLKGSSSSKPDSSDELRDIPSIPSRSPPKKKRGRPRTNTITEVPALAEPETPRKTRRKMQHKFKLENPLSPIKQSPAHYYDHFVVILEPDPEPEDTEDPLDTTLLSVDEEPVELYDEDDIEAALLHDRDVAADKIKNIRMENEDQPESGEESCLNLTAQFYNSETVRYTVIDATSNVENQESHPPVHRTPSLPVLPEGKQRESPTQTTAKSALMDISKLLSPPRKKGPGHTDPNYDRFKRSRMEGIQMLLNLYTNPMAATYDAWVSSSLQAAVTLGRGLYCARQLRKMARQFIADRNVLPCNPYGSWNESMLVDEDLSNDINLYLQELGGAITAKKLVDFLARADVKMKHGITRSISERTGRRYLNALGYRWATAKKGQYADGHEREDVVQYRKHIFLPAWNSLQNRMQNWSNDGLLELGPPLNAEKRVIVWFHDETIFYAHDRRKKGWYHKDAPAKPYAKGDGVSLMIADFVSADFGWLRSNNQSARRIMKPGKNRDGYFSSEDIISQVNAAMDIVLEAWPQYDHVFVYDNASTHLKRREDSLSARKLPKNIPKKGTNWGVEVDRRDPITRKVILKPDGSHEKMKVRMCDTILPGGRIQSLYFPEDHPQFPGIFKGMARILEERGFSNASKLRAECKSFKCADPTTVKDCCCRRLLYTQPDFENVETILGAQCRARGFQVVFLPKFHCELNFIEQCWGFAKRVYRLFPESSREDHLEKNALSALEQVPLTSMRRFANRSRRFMDAYTTGLDGRQAAWAARKYRGHRVLPASIMDDLEKAKMA